VNSLKPYRTAVCVAFIASLLMACETTNSPHKNPYQDTFDEAGVRSILIVPAVNRSVNVYAPGTMLSTLPALLGDQGYYVFPVNTVKVVLENEGLYEAADIHKLPTEKLAAMFGANAVLYISVEEWDSRYVVFSATTGVTVHFRMVASNGNDIWHAEKTIEKTSQNNTSTDSMLISLIGDALSAAMERAFPDYRPLALQASQEVFLYDSTRIPIGPYHPSRIDSETSIDAKDEALTSPAK